MCYLTSQYSFKPKSKNGQSKQIHIATSEQLVEAELKTRQIKNSLKSLQKKSEKVIMSC